MTKVLFCCHGNICRSPMAEFVMKDLARKAGLDREIEAASAATTSEEIGDPVYPSTRRKLAGHGINCAGKTARLLTCGDYQRYDFPIGMDDENMWDMRHICGGDTDRKIHLLMEYAGRPGSEVSDPWYARLGAPIWAETVCLLAKAFLHHYGRLIKSKVFYVITHMAKNPYDTPIAQLDNILGHPHSAHLSVSTKKENLESEINAFISQIQIE